MLGTLSERALTDSASLTTRSGLPTYEEDPSSPYEASRPIDCSYKRFDYLELCLSYSARTKNQRGFDRSRVT